MDEIDTTKNYRFTDGTKVKSIKRAQGCSDAWDNRGGGKAFYELVLEDGTMLREWYYHTGKRTGEKGPVWEHPRNLILEEEYQRSVFIFECGCGIKEFATVDRSAQFWLQFPCSKCGCMYELVGEREERERKQRDEELKQQAVIKLASERKDKLSELKRLKKIAADKNISAEVRLKNLQRELTKLQKTAKLLVAE